MDYYPLFPEALLVLNEAATRHAAAFAVVHEAIDLAHLIEDRVRNYAARITPGVPRSIRVAGDVNDSVWRCLRVIGEPLIAEKRVREFRTIDNGDFLILNDGMIVRVKKGDAEGTTSNYPTPRQKGIRRTANEAVFSGVSPLDEAILDGVVFDIAYKRGAAFGSYTGVVLRHAATEGTPTITIDPPTAEALGQISPAVFQLASEMRSKLAS